MIKTLQKNVQVTDTSIAMHNALTKAMAKSAFNLNIKQAVKRPFDNPDCSAAILKHHFDGDTVK